MLLLTTENNQQRMKIQEIDNENALIQKILSDKDEKIKELMTQILLHTSENNQKRIYNH